MKTMTHPTPPAQLPPELLARLRDNKKWRRNPSGPTRDPAAMREAATYFGIKKRQNDGDWWNDTLDALDAYDPLWRGYAVLVTKPMPLQYRQASKGRNAA